MNDLVQFEYRGVRAVYSTEYKDDALQYTGVDVPNLLKTAIDRMLSVSNEMTGSGEVYLRLQNPTCSADECTFEIRVAKK